MQFVDECYLHLKAGDGGNGVVAWRREAHYPEGGPWGGDGGDGGDIILIGDHNVSTLFHLRNQKNVIAPNGQNGQTKMATGKSGKTVYLPIPLGTVVYFVNATEPIVEILTSGQTHTICHGGKGGHGNAFFKSSFNKAPTLHENGDIGESCHVILKLKYIADVGIIGLPNAGKSTLIGQISNAKPKVANYQFTTLVPVLGKVKIGHNELVFADIPGLIAGAAHGKGLGHEFLKHIERCHVLIHLISLNTTDHDNIIDAYKTILDELQQYNPILAQKATIIVANKNDLPNATTNLEILNDYLKQEVLSISAVKGNNINKLLEQVRLTYENVKKHLDQQAPSPSHITIELKQQKDYTKDLVIKQIADHTWSIQSEFMAYWTKKIPLDSKDNIIRYNQKMQTIKVEETAKKLGAKPGDTLLIYGNEFVVDR